jgi:hypothetical protein
MPERLPKRFEESCDDFGWTWKELRYSRTGASMASRCSPSEVVQKVGKSGCRTDLEYANHDRKGNEKRGNHRNRQLPMFEFVAQIFCSAEADMVQGTVS